MRRRNLTLCYDAQLLTFTESAILWKAWGKDWPPEIKRARACFCGGPYGCWRTNSSDQHESDRLPGFQGGRRMVIQ